MTKFMTGKPFSVPVSRGNLTDRDYFIRVGALIYCPKCDDYRGPNHACKPSPKGN